MNSNLTNQKSSPRREMTKLVTSYLAAWFILDSSFPRQEDLPSVKPVPFTNFGHQPLLDNKLFHSIIWTVIGEIQREIKPWKKNEKLRSLTSWFVGIFFALVFLESTGFFGSLIALFFALWLTNLCFNKFLNYEKYKYKVAEVRAHAIKSLINGSWNNSAFPDLQEKVGKYASYYGSGRLDEEECPVVIVLNDQQPFPGFGWLQQNSSYICPRKEENLELSEDIAKVEEEAMLKIKERISKTDIRHISFGELLSVHGKDIPIDSSWLDSEKRPLLSVTKQAIQKKLDSESETSVRRYYAVEILFPKHMTMATFFLRFFPAGNGIAFQLAFTTLGPPGISRSRFEKALLKNQLEQNDFLLKNPLEKNSFSKNKLSVKSKKTFSVFKKVISWLQQLSKQPEKVLDPFKKILTDLREIYNFFKEDHAHLKFIRKVEELIKEEKKFQSDVNLSAILKLKFENFVRLTDGQKLEYEEAFSNIVEGSALWPSFTGNASGNLREINSSAFTEDFFGLPEAKASIKILYDQISKAVLDSFEELGYDVSDYKDKDGNYSINAASIDQLVVGEKVSIENMKVDKSQAKRNEDDVNQNRAKVEKVKTGDYKIELNKNS